MKKQELVAQLAKEIAVTQEQAGNILNILDVIMLDNLKAGKDIPLGLGKIKMTTSKTREMKVPGGKVVTVQASRSLRLAPSKYAKDTLNK